MKEFSNDPISEAICAVEKQYEEDKQGWYQQKYFIAKIRSYS